ncbi:S1 domain-containing protein, partial [Cephalotus follicularis]
MDGLPLTTAVTGGSSLATNGLLFRSIPVTRIGVTLKRNIFFTRRRRYSIFAAKEDPKFDHWDQMELKFGRLLGEDPKLTLAKIMARKTNPDASFIEVEKAFYKNKGKMVEIEEVPFDLSMEKRSSNSNSLDGLNLVKPVPKKGVKLQTVDKPVTPALDVLRKPNQTVNRVVDSGKSSVPNVILRKPTTFNEVVVEDNRPRYKSKPNLWLKMESDQGDEKFSDVTLLRRPEPLTMNAEDFDKKKTYGDVKPNDSIGLTAGKSEGQDNNIDFTLLNKPQVTTMQAKLDEEQEVFGDAEAKDTEYTEENGLKAELEAIQTANATKTNLERMQPLEQRNMKFSEKENAVFESSDTDLVDGNVEYDATLLGKPKILEQSVQETSSSSVKETISMNSEICGSSAEIKCLPTTSPLEDADWTRAEDLVKTGEREEVELISSSNKGFMVSFGSLIGFLPYRNLAARWKFIAFESWLRQKGLDPSMYRQNLGIIGSYDFQHKTSTRDSSVGLDIDQKSEGEISSDMNLEDLLKIYDQEKIKFLSSFVGQKIKLIVVMADKMSRKLIFSMKPREREELVERKRSLMAKLQIGDVVKCCIKKITYFGIFVVVEDVPALIHQTEVSWDSTLDPASYFKIGQILEAKVHQLDFSLGRIFLSLKEIMPDPLTETLESVVSGRDPPDGRLQIAQADIE